MPKQYHWPKVGRVVFYGKEYSDRMDREYRRRTRNAADLMLRRVRGKVSRNYPPASQPGEYPRRRSGALAQGYYVKYGKSLLSFRLMNRAPHSDYLEFDTRGGKIIRPRTAKALRWIDPATGKRVFRKWVRQGPIKGRQHIRRVLLESRNDLKRIWRTRVTGIVRVG